MTFRLDLRHYLLDDEPAQWATAFVRKLAEGREVPLYGSEEWTAAPWPLQVSSAVRASESWRRSGLCLASDLADELARGAQWLDREAEAFLAAACRNMASSPTHAELVERRRVA